MARRIVTLVSQGGPEMMRNAIVSTTDAHATTVTQQQVQHAVGLGKGDAVRATMVIICNHLALDAVVVAVVLKG